MKVLALCTKYSERKRNWLLKNEVELLKNEFVWTKMKSNARKWNRMYFVFLFEIEKGISTSYQFRCEVERPFTNLNDESAKLAGKTYIMSIKIPHCFFISNCIFINYAACSGSSYGANCEQTCHCNSSSCDNERGCSGNCHSGYGGDFSLCQGIYKKK